MKRLLLQPYSRANVSDSLWIYGASTGHPTHRGYIRSMALLKGCHTYLLLYTVILLGLKGLMFRSSERRQPWSVHLKPIFHQNAKYLASGVGVGQCPRRQNFVLEIPTCWYILALPNAKICVFPDANPQRHIGCVGSQCKILVLAMYISCFLCRFHLRLVPNANPISSGIWALYSQSLVKPEDFISLTCHL